MRLSLRTLLAPVVWVANKLGTRREVSRDDAQQAEAQWLYGAQAIIDYLRERFG